MEDSITTIRETVTALIERIDINGGLGEYKGGKPFIVSDVRAILPALSAIATEIQTLRQENDFLKQHLTRHGESLYWAKFIRPKEILPHPDITAAEI